MNNTEKIIEECRYCKRAKFGFCRKHTPKLKISTKKLYTEEELLKVRSQTLAEVEEKIKEGINNLESRGILFNCTDSVSRVEALLVVSDVKELLSLKQKSEEESKQ